jgi:hypothetical protein
MCKTQIQFVQLKKTLITNPFFKYEFSKRKALEINRAQVKLGSEGMHLMARHHPLHLPQNSEPPRFILP